MSLPYHKIHGITPLNPVINVICNERLLKPVILALLRSSTEFLYRLTAFSLADSCHGNGPLTLAQGSVFDR